MLWRTRFAASTHPILLRMGPQSLKVPHGTVLVLTLRFARSSSCHGPWFEVCLVWMVFPLERRSRWYNPRKRHNTVAQILRGSLESRTQHNTTQHNTTQHNTTRYPGGWTRMRRTACLPLNVCTTHNPESVRSLQGFAIRDVTVCNNAQMCVCMSVKSQRQCHWQSYQHGVHLHEVL
jgi:hypothetical protein